MKNGILRNDEGFDILINGEKNSFRDTWEAAYAGAHYAKQKHPRDIVEILDRSTAGKQLMLDDGKLG